MLQHDPSLDGVGLVIFDEFHERSLDADLALALMLETRDVLRPDLRALVMSATLDGARVARMLGDAPIITLEGRAFPVETRYVDRRSELRVEDAVASVVRRALVADDGDLLVFLPGTGEIRRIRSLTAGDLRRERTSGLFTARCRRPSRTMRSFRAFRRAQGRARDIDRRDEPDDQCTCDRLGLSTRPRFSPRRDDEPRDCRVSRASADQRRGRASQSPGVCWLWGEQEQHHLVAHASPEILKRSRAARARSRSVQRRRSRLGAVARRAVAGRVRAGPRALVELGALEPPGESGTGGRITPRGRRMAELLHPRLAHGGRGRRWVRCDSPAAAAPLSERDPIRAAGPARYGRGHRNAARAGARSRSCARARPVLNRDALWRIRSESQRLLAALGGSSRRSDVMRLRMTSHAGVLLAFAYPDRISQLRAPRSAASFKRKRRRPRRPVAVGFRIRRGGRAGCRRPESRIFLAARLELEDLERHFAEQITLEQEITWDAREAQSLRARGSALARSFWRSVRSKGGSRRGACGAPRRDPTGRHGRAAVERRRALSQATPRVSADHRPVVARRLG